MYVNKRPLSSWVKPHFALVKEDNTPQAPRFPVIDAHAHLGNWKWDTPIGMPNSEGDWPFQDIPAALDLMDEVNIRCTISLDGGWGDTLKRNIERYKEPYPERFAIFSWVDWSKIDQSDFGDKRSKELEKGELNIPVTIHIADPVAFFLPLDETNERYE